MKRFRICFLGTPEFAEQHLRALLDCESYELVGVVTQPDRPAGRKMQLTPSAVKKTALEKKHKLKRFFFASFCGPLYTITGFRKFSRGNISVQYHKQAISMPKHHAEKKSGINKRRLAGERHPVIYFNFSF